MYFSGFFFGPLTRPSYVFRILFSTRPLQTREMSKVDQRSVESIKKKLTPNMIESHSDLVGGTFFLLEFETNDTFNRLSSFPSGPSIWSSIHDELL